MGRAFARDDRRGVSNDTPKVMTDGKRRLGVFADDQPAAVLLARGVLLLAAPGAVPG
jgi:hypothetical protein